MATVYGINTAKAELIFRIGTTNMLNVMWFEKPLGGIAYSDLIALGFVIESEWWAELRAEIAQECTLETIRLTQWEFAGGHQYTRSVNTAGLRTGGVVSNNVASVVTHLTGLTGRSRQGRSYICGLNEERVSHNTLAGASQTVFITAFLQMWLNVQSEGWEHVVSSAYSGGFPRALRMNTPVSGYRCDTRVDTQRRRMPNVWGN